MPFCSIKCDDFFQLLMSASPLSQISLVIPCNLAWVLKRCAQSLTIYDVIVLHQQLLLCNVSCTPFLCYVCVCICIFKGRLKAERTDLGDMEKLIRKLLLCACVYLCVQVYSVMMRVRNRLLIARLSLSHHSVRVEKTEIRMQAYTHFQHCVIPTAMRSGSDN